MEIMDGMSLDLEQTNKEKLKAVFPECFSEDSLDMINSCPSAANISQRETKNTNLNGKVNPSAYSLRKDAQRVRFAHERTRAWGLTIPKTFISRAII